MMAAIDETQAKRREALMRKLAADRKKREQERDKANNFNDLVNSRKSGLGY